MTALVRKRPKARIYKYLEIFKSIKSKAKV